jgi:hypothetical protein
MKNFIQIFAMALVLNALNSCNQAPVKSDNMLLPDKLLVADNVPFDSSFLQTASTRYIDSSVHPVFNYKPEADYPELLTQKALDGKIAIFNPDAIVDWEQNPILEPINDTLLRVKLGEVEVMVSMQVGDSTIVQTQKLPIDLHQMVSLYTVEEWNFTTQPLAFTKKVNLLMPVRRYQKGNISDEYRFMKLFCFVNPIGNQAKNLQPLAHVEYEYVFNQPGAFLRADYNRLVSAMLQDDECMSDAIVSSYNAPWFNSISQQKLVHELLNQVFEGKANAVDSETGQPLSADEARKQIFIESTISYTDEDGIEQTRTIETDRTSTIRSVIFTEDWSYNPQTMGLVKKVTGIAPVCYFNYEGSANVNLIRRQVAFKILIPE